ncbi:MAG: UvrD-helicase domain-containing protein, partial [Rubrobacteraceae bacterium]|nr:UvrD-helicase domain-containing protein [Rubrobacteraceae bacterium]
MSFELIHKPTFTNQLLAIPKERVVQILEKTTILTEDPSPHGSQKKKLHGYTGSVYRLRSGDYRVLYTYGDGWVTLLGVDDRKDIYKGDRLIAEEPGVPVSSIPDVDEILQPAPTYENVAPDTAEQETEELPFVIDEDLLRQLRVPREHSAALLDCKTLDDLIKADVPEPVRGVIFDAATPPDYEHVLDQPDFLTGDVSDLLRFKEGELLGFLLKLDPEQEKYVDWAVNSSGPTLVKGGPGTGKSTVALYRTHSLVRSLRESGVENPRVLFTTYTNALVAFSEQLLGRLLGKDRNRVTVRTADSLVVRIVASVDGQQDIADSQTLGAALKDALGKAAFDGIGLQKRAQRRTIEQLSQDYLLEEINTVIEAREIGSLDEYLLAPRAGRRVGLNQTQRTAVWRVYESFCRVLDRRKLVTWQQVRCRALEIVRSGGWEERFDGVIVDEAQDLDPTVLRLLVALCRTPNRLFVAADA